jgi:hypothetical protein
MTTIRPVSRVYASSPTIEGAGVHLRRAFGFDQTGLFDPFLMLDDFRSNDPASFTAGFPWHPHRGIETVTYVLTGEVAHGDSMGNRGVIGPGCVQWMTAGGGIVHQEMPEGDDEGRLEGFQLWVNLPASQKMREARYRGVTSDEIPAVTTADGSVVRVIAGEVDGVKGPVGDIVVEPEYLDVTVPCRRTFVHRTTPDHTVFAYVIAGRGRFEPEGEGAGNHTVILFGEGDEVEVTAGDDGVRFLLVSGKPLGEPIAWSGPIVMNTQQELRDAFRQYADGTFLGHKRAS